MGVNGYFSAAKSSPGMSIPDRKDQAANLAVNFFFICPAQSENFYLLHSVVITHVKCAIEMHLSFMFYLLTVFLKRLFFYKIINDTVEKMYS